jgi:hypothetical protein
MRAPIREAQQHCKLSLGIIDNTAAGDASYTWSDAAWEPDFFRIAGDEACPMSGIASFENDYFRLDGKQTLIDDSYSTHDYVSDALSGNDGVYATPPEITISFGVTHTLVGLSLGFGPDVNDAPAQITFLWYSDETLISQSTVTFEKKGYQQAELDITGADKLIIRYDKAAKEGRHARLCQLVYGIGYNFQDTQIISVSEKHTDAPVSTSLPTSSLSFSLDNSDGRFTADSGNSLVQFLADQQKVTVSYGVDLSTGTEWIPGGVWYLSDWSSSEASASFSAVGRIELLTKTQYEKGVYDWNNHTASSLAKAVFLDAGVAENDYYIDPSVYDTFGAPLPLATHADELELLANRTAARLFDGKDGVIHLERSPYSVEWTTTSADYHTMGFYDKASTLLGSSVEYATFESNFFRLDGNQNLLPDDLSSIIEGSAFVSSGISGVDFTFPSDNRPLFFTITVGNPTRVANVSYIQLDFGTKAPRKIWLYCAIRGGKAIQKYVFIDSSKPKITLNARGVSSIQISITQTNHENERAHLKSISISTVSDFTMDESEAFGAIQTSLNTKLKDVTAEWIYRSFYPNATDTLATARITTNSGWVRIEHPCGYEPSMVVSLDDPDGVTVEQIHYAFVSYVKLTSDTAKTVTVTITSNKMYEVSYPISSSANDTGENLPLTNALYDNTNIQDTLDWTRDYYRQRVEYSLETKGYPELECGDFVRARDGSPAQIIETDLTYNGAFREKFKLRKKE